MIIIKLLVYYYRINKYAVAVGGNSLAGCKGFDICFGGRRKFCKADYSDLGKKILH